MNLATFLDWIKRHEGTLQDLAAQQKYVLGSLRLGTLLTRTASAEQHAALFGNHRATVEAMTTLIQSNFLATYPHPVLIDFNKAVSLYLDSCAEAASPPPPPPPSSSSKEQASDENAREIQTALLMARVNFMGTDGIRGKVVCSLDNDNHNADCIQAMVHDNAFTPQLVRVTAYSFAVLLLQQPNGTCQPGDTVVIGNDGRDAAQDWQFNAALQDGLQRAGLHVLDVGVVPTAVVPWKMLQRQHVGVVAGGACLTASHNPSNQNGVKFFVHNGNKLLPEGPLGDYALSALMFQYGSQQHAGRLTVLPEPPRMGTVTREDCSDEIVAWMQSVLSADDTRHSLQDLMLVFDSANGATHNVGRALLDELGATYTSRNETPTGDNINRACGVAEIEGTDVFYGTEYNSHIAFVQEIFDQGRRPANKAGKVWGIPVDGDGDRGFLLYYDKHSDNVHVLDGDKCGYILAQYLIKKQNLNPADHWFLSTIESDIMTASAAAQNLGLQTRVVSVGDKWIGNFDKADKIIMGLEISGHVIFPIAVTDDQGHAKTLLSGVGILTGLMTLVAIKSLELPQSRILEPFEPGFSKTFYVYFVDKTKHFRGSAIWNKDISIVQEGVEAAKAAGQLPADTQIILEEKEDPHVLYMNIKSGDKLLGVLFMRNSGTEDKNATYVKGDKAYEKVLVPIGKRVQTMHMQEMKNKGRIEFVYEKLTLEKLAQGDSTVDILLDSIGAAGEAVTETDLFSVLHGLKKEGRIVVEGRKVRFHQNETKVWPL